MHAHSHVCVGCLICVFSDFCVESGCKCVYTAPNSPTPISLPFHPSLRRFTQRHQGLASWCLHCKSGLTIRRWLDPTHIQKHLIYLFIFLSCRASRCIISDQGDIPTSKCYSLHLQVNLLTNKLKQDILNEILMGWCANDSSLASYIHRKAIRPSMHVHVISDQVLEWVKVLQSVTVSTFGEWIWI